MSYEPIHCGGVLLVLAVAVDADERPAGPAKIGTTTA